MNTPSPTGRSSAQTAFTLIELLVVITIIAVLAGLLLPVTQKVLENAKKTSAKTTETQILSAVNAFQTEYGQYPVPSALVVSPPTDITFGIDAAHHNQPLFDILRNLETTNVLNTRHIVYFESKNVKNALNPRDGFIPPGTTSAPGNPNAKSSPTTNAGDLVDPWGNMYGVRLDSGYTNAVINPYSQATLGASDSDVPPAIPDPTDTTLIRTGVIAWSWGNDGIMNTVAKPYSPTPGDDVVSWQ